MAESGATIKIRRSKPGNPARYIDIIGTAAQVAKADEVRQLLVLAVLFQNLKNPRARLPKSIYLPDQMILATIADASSAKAASSADTSTAGGDGPQQTHEMTVPSHQNNSEIGPGGLLITTVIYIAGLDH